MLYPNNFNSSNLPNLTKKMLKDLAKDLDAPCVISQKND